MEKKASLTSQIMKADMERSCLLYFNDILFSKGQISQEEYRAMQLAIAARARAKRTQR